MSTVSQPQIKETLLDEMKQFVEEDRMQLITDIVNISQIPAPTFEEEPRADFIEQRFEELGADTVDRDSAGNVIAQVKNRETPVICFVAHLDTVFDSSVDHTVNLDDRVIAGAGVGDDALGLASLLSMIRFLSEDFPANMIFVATTGTEGDGNLRGSRYFVENCRFDIDCAICLEGHRLGRIDHRSLGTNRIQIKAKSKGGHVWRDETGENPIGVMGDLIARLKRLQEEYEKSEETGIVNVGIIRGGTAYNTVPYDCELKIEIRSDSEETLQQLQQRVREVVVEIKDNSTVDLELEEVSVRPVSGIPVDHWLVETVKAIHRDIGIGSSPGAASSDGCIYLSEGIPTVTLGLAEGENKHLEDEFIQLDSLEAGQLQVLMLVELIKNRQ